MQITCQKFRWDYWSLTSSGDVREPHGTSRKARLQLRTPAPRGCCHRQGRAPPCEASRSLRLVRAALRCENAPLPQLHSPPFKVLFLLGKPGRKGSSVAKPPRALQPDRLLLTPGGVAVPPACWVSDGDVIALLRSRARRHPHRDRHFVPAFTYAAPSCRIIVLNFWNSAHEQVILSVNLRDSQDML